MIKEDLDFFEEHLDIRSLDYEGHTNLETYLYRIWKEIKRLAIYGEEAEEMARQGKFIVSLKNLPKRKPHIVLTREEIKYYGLEDDDNDS